MQPLLLIGDMFWLAFVAAGSVVALFWMAQIAWFAWLACRRFVSSVCAPVANARTYLESGLLERRRIENARCMELVTAGEGT